MRMQFPNGVVQTIRKSHGVKLQRRRLNQTAVYFVTYGDVTVHVGGARHCRRQFNRYVRALSSLGFDAIGYSGS